MIQFAHYTEEGNIYVSLRKITISGTSLYTPIVNLGQVIIHCQKRPTSSFKFDQNDILMVLQCIYYNLDDYSSSCHGNIFLRVFYGLAQIYYRGV